MGKLFLFVFIFFITGLEAQELQQPILDSQDSKSKLSESNFLSSSIVSNILISANNSYHKVEIEKSKKTDVNNCCANVTSVYNNQSLINTFYPPQNNQTVLAGSTTINLESVPPDDIYGNSFGNQDIQPGDLLLIIQMQGANFNPDNSDIYGSGISNSGIDLLGATGYTSLDNCGNFEYVVALNHVPLSGGVLQINNICNVGLANTYENYNSTFSNVIKRFQVVRVPRFQNLTLNNNIITTAWNGRVGGVIAVDVIGDLNLNGFSIDASGRGFRGGFQNVRPSGNSNATITTFDNNISSGKGEGISGTPRFMWNGINSVDYGASWVGYLGGDYGRGAPGNAGGGGNIHNAGGGGGGNGGQGGVGGNGWASQLVNGGRPGNNIPYNNNKIFLGGGGGGGDANNATTGVKGGPGGGIIMLQAKEIIGNGQIISNGFDGQAGAYFGNPDGAGGGGSGGSILILTSQSSNSTAIDIQTKGGKGGDTLNDSNNPHGPGGGGGGGIVMHNIQNSTLNINVAGGSNGLTANGNEISHGATSGQDGIILDYNVIGNLPILINNLYPNPSANFDVSDICLGETINPNNTSNVLNLFNSNIVTYNWDFGDGTTSSLPNPSHLYTQYGPFDITLTVLTNWGCSDTYTHTINISNPITPTFTQINQINCGNSFILPTTSINGITGAWTPAINNSSTTEYTFTPIAGQCFKSASMTVVIINPSNPTGVSAQSFCNSATIADLIAVGTNIIWYSNPTIGTPLPSNTPLSNGTTYYASQTVNGCESINLLAVTASINSTSSPTGVSTQSFCNSATIADLTAVGTNIIWYSTPTIGTPLPSNTSLSNGTTYYASQTANGCESTNLLAVAVSINTTLSPTGNSTQSFCNSATIADLTAVGTNLLWYSSSAGGTPLTSNTVLVNGNTYYASQTANGCESLIRFAVLSLINSTPTPTGNGNQNFCGSATVGNLTAVGTNVNWYLTPTGGTILPPNTTLINGTTYYASQTINSCASLIRLSQNVLINNIPNPPTGVSTQSFCNSATIADLTAVGTNIIWYSTPTIGTPLPSNTSLSNGTTYYASQTANGCESTNLLAVAVSINTTLSPTGNSTQSFCNSATIADLTAVGTNLLWYSSSAGGTPLTSNTVLVNGNTYYASQTANGCESLIRFAVLSLINSTPTPTGNGNQNFCLADNQTVSDLQSNQTNVIWYSSLTNSTPLIPNTLLIDGQTYYASQIDLSTGCESKTRFEVVVSLINPSIPYGSPTQQFCIENNPTISSLILNSNQLVWYDSPINGNILPSNHQLSNGEIVYAESYENINNCHSISRFQVVINVINPELTFYDLITVNNNSSNSKLTITGIDEFPQNEIQIFNRYGEIVWSSVNYNNTANYFIGKANVRGIYMENNYLPTGTYYFVINYNNPCEKKQLKGFLQIDNIN